MKSQARATSKRWKLRLYLAGNAPQNRRIHAGALSICERHLSGQYDLKVIDVLRSPGKARQDGVCSVPALVRLSPGPVRNVIGDLHNPNYLFKALGISD